MLLRQIHTAAAYWGLVIIASRIDTHGEMIVSGLRLSFAMSFSIMSIYIFGTYYAIKALAYKKRRVTTK